jgi:hypothetical protein
LGWLNYVRVFNFASPHKSKAEYILTTMKEELLAAGAL